MTKAGGALLIAMSLVGCAEKQARLECTVQERGPAGRTFKIAANASEPEANGTREFQGTTSFVDGTKQIERPIHGYYLQGNETRKLELIGFSDRPTERDKLNFSVQPNHPVLQRRGTAAVVMTGAQTVETGTLAGVTCRTVEPS